MTDRVYSFSAGPAVLPLPVLEQARDEIVCLPGAGMSVLEMSHRSPAFKEIIEAAEAGLRSLLGIPASYRVLFLQGGSRLQFSMVPANLLRGSGRAADYILTGSWGKNARLEAVKEGPVNVVFDGKETGYDRLPTADQLQLDPQAAYVHFTSNETIQGVQFATEPSVGEAPLVCDASSDFLSRPLPIERYGMIYACAQKNAGPAGVTVVILREDLVERGSEDLPGYLQYRLHAGADSMWNTPPTYAIYLLCLVTRWLEHEVGGLEAMAKRNRQKALQLYEVIDASDGFYAGHASSESRSLMNVTFRLPDAEREAAFLAEARGRKLVDLKGHRSVGGIRASIYNAMPVEGVEALRQFMLDFQKRHG